MDVAVVLATYNRAESLRGALHSLCAQETGGAFTFEVVVVDDGSTDETFAVVQQIGATSAVPIRYLRTLGGGQVQATNLAIEASSAPWVALFDDDQLAGADWLRAMMTTAARTGARCIGSARRLQFIGDQPCELGTVCRQLLGEHLPYPAERKYTGRLFPQGGCSLIAREVFASAGLFKQRFAFGGYDTDLFRSARTSGFASWYSSAAVVYHLIPPYRTRAEYFRWASLRMGANFALMDAHYQGTLRLVSNCIARIGQTLLLNLPRLFAAWATRDTTQCLDTECLLVRAYAYTRQTAQLLVPRLFTQAAFFRGLEFRSERTSNMSQARCQ
jgi:GT2 family glycosyltransferase